MSGTGQLQNDRLVKGLTRPPMILGVTFNLFFLNLTASLLSFVITNNTMILLVIFPAIHLTGYIISQKEPLFIDIFLLKMKKCNKCNNKIYHGKNSYDPL